jgi:hypothetical protein
MVSSLSEQFIIYLDANFTVRIKALDKLNYVKICYGSFA